MSSHGRENRIYADFEVRDSTFGSGARGPSGVEDVHVRRRLNITGDAAFRAWNQPSSLAHARRGHSCFLLWRIVSSGWVSI